MAVRFPFPVGITTKVRPKKAFSKLAVTPIPKPPVPPKVTVPPAYEDYLKKIEAEAERARKELTASIAGITGRPLTSQQYEEFKSWQAEEETRIETWRTGEIAKLEEGRVAPTVAPELATEELIAQLPETPPPEAGIATWQEAFGLPPEADWREYLRENEWVITGELIRPELQQIVDEFMEYGGLSEEEAKAFTNFGAAFEGVKDDDEALGRFLWETLYEIRTWAGEPIDKFKSHFEYMWSAKGWEAFWRAWSAIPRRILTPYATWGTMEMEKIYQAKPMWAKFLAEFANPLWYVIPTPSVVGKAWSGLSKLTGKIPFIGPTTQRILTTIPRIPKIMVGKGIKYTSQFRQWLVKRSIKKLADFHGFKFSSVIHDKFSKLLWNRMKLDVKKYADVPCVRKMADYYKAMQKLPSQIRMAKTAQQRTSLINEATKNLQDSLELMHTSGKMYIGAQQHYWHLINETYSVVGRAVRTTAGFKIAPGATRLAVSKMPSATALAEFEQALMIQQASKLGGLMQAIQYLPIATQRAVITALETILIEDVHPADIEVRLQQLVGEVITEKTPEMVDVLKGFGYTDTYIEALPANQMLVEVLKQTAALVQTGEPVKPAIPVVAPEAPAVAKPAVPEVRKPRGAVEVEGWWVWLRGNYAIRYKTAESLIEAREREATRVEIDNPRLAQRCREMTLLEWLQQGGAIARKERIAVAKPAVPEIKEPTTKAEWEARYNEIKRDAELSPEEFADKYRGQYGEEYLKKYPYALKYRQKGMKEAVATPFEEQWAKHEAELKAKLVTPEVPAVPELAEAETVRIQQGIQTAIAEHAYRLEHGWRGKTTGFTGFWITQDGKIYQHNRLRDIPPSERQGLVNVHSHSPSGWQARLAKGEIDAFDPPNAGDVENLQQSVRNGWSDTMVVIMGDGRMEILYVPDSAKSAFVRLSKSTIRKSLQLSYAERVSIGKETGLPDHEINRDALRQFAEKNGLIYQTGLSWKDDVLSYKGRVTPDIYGIEPKITPRVVPEVPAAPPAVEVKPEVFMTEEMWEAMPIASRAKAAREAGLESAVGSRAWGELTAREKGILGHQFMPGEGLSADQLDHITEVGKAKMMISELGKTTPNMRRLMKALVGETRINKLTREQADVMIDALGRLEVKYGKPPKIPTTLGLITKEFADKIPLLKEISIVEKIRPSRLVFEKMGLRAEIADPAFKAEVEIYEELMAFRKELRAIAKLVGKSKERRAIVFQALENPTLAYQLTKAEQKALEWFRGYFANWADKLKLPVEKRRAHYITHIFEAEITQMLKAKHPLDPALIRALDYITPKRVFNPYLQERLGQRIGLIEDPFKATEAYEARALKVYHYEPLIQRIRVYEKYLPPNAARYLRGYITRITNRPLPIDREANQALKEFAGAIKGLPLGKELGKYLTRGNAAGLAAYQYSSLLYTLWLAFKPTSAIRNASQSFLSIAEVGILNFVRGIRFRFTAEGQKAWHDSVMRRGRRQAWLPGLDTSFASRWIDKVRETGLIMFRGVDKKANVPQAFLGGYAEAKHLGLPYEWCVKRGDEVAADTQYMYTRLGGAAWSQSALGRVLSPLTTWPENFMELLTKWVRGKPSYVYRDYEVATGKTLPKPNWLLRRKSLLIYMTILALAYAVDKNTRLRPFEYTGWTSVSYLADIAAGELPALTLPGSVAKVIAGFLTQNDWMLNEGWSELKPVRLMGIIRQLDSIISGRNDWLTLFFYLKGQDWKFDKLRDEWSGGFLEYDALPTGTPRNVYREENPEIDAKMFVLGRTTTLQTDEARNIVLDLIREHELDTELIDGYDKIFGVDVSEQLTPYRDKLGTYSMTDKKYYTTNNYASEVNSLVRIAGRTKIETADVPLAVEYLQAADQWVGYYDLPSGEPRRTYRERYPEIEAQLFFWGKLTTVRSIESAQIVYDLMQTYNIRSESIRAFAENPDKYRDLLEMIGK